MENRRKAHFYFFFTMDSPFLVNYIIWKFISLSSKLPQTSCLWLSQLLVFASCANISFAFGVSSCTPSKFFMHPH
ncbi:hypothetical protein VNO80_21843 [Phaseolus coccineus]|uniref:Uncharacterized protein n=1 Tax=Phaseolus coccineus TaxID=3886 RepID=A0AAN9QY38_PHACN